MSVVICAYNERRHVVRLLESLNKQTTAPKEIVLVDDGSTDETAELAARAGATVVRTDHRGPALGRNLGALKASGDVLVFLDADMACAPEFIERLVAPISSGAIGSFTREIYLGLPANAWSLAYCYIRRLGIPRLLPRDFPDEWANYRAILRSSFLAIGGYDDVGYGEDMTLAPKVGSLAKAAPGAVCWHYNPDTPYEIFENARWIGRGFDVRNVTHPVRDNLPSRALLQGVRDLKKGAPAAILLARQIYCLGFLCGLALRALLPQEHAK